VKQWAGQDNIAFLPLQVTSTEEIDFKDIMKYIKMLTSQAQNASNLFFGGGSS
jgi:hypothetical protein